MNAYNTNGNSSDNWMYNENQQNNLQFVQQQQQQQQQQQFIFQTINAQFPMHPAPPGLTYVQGGIFQNGHGGYQHLNYGQPQAGPHMVSQYQQQGHMMGSAHMSGGSIHLSQQGSGYMTQGSTHLSQSSGPIQGSCAQASSLSKGKGAKYATEEKMIASEDERANYGKEADECLIEHLELNIFKHIQCPNQNMQHNHKQCQFYHGLKDRRRVGMVYSSEQCQHIDSFGASCPFGDKCQKSHNKVEQLYCAEKYKTKFCTHYPGDCKQCEYGEFCSFAHNENDIKAELIHNYEFDVDFYVFKYKTVWCPFNYINHDRGMCVYAHNWQDYRRKPNQTEEYYEPESCQSWDPNSFITDYELGCPNKQSCNKCHGWKELEYHPMVYRTKPCMQQPCPKAKACPYYHSSAEKRITKGLYNSSPSFIPKEIKSQSMNSSAVNQQERSHPQRNNMFSSASSQTSATSSNQIQNDLQIIINGGANNSSSQFKKENTLYNKKMKLGSATPKINTCSDFTQKQEELPQGDINSSKGKGDDVNKKESGNLNSLHRLKKPIPSKSLSAQGNGSIQFKRCESQSIDGSSSDESSPKNENKQIKENSLGFTSTNTSQKVANSEKEDLKKSLKIASPQFQELESCEKIKQKADLLNSQNNESKSPTQVSKKEIDFNQDNSQQDNNPPSPLNQFESAFSNNIQQNKEQASSFIQQHHHHHHQQIPFQQQQINLNVFSQNQQVYAQQNTNMSNALKNDLQDEEDFQQINALIDNIL